VRYSRHRTRHDIPWNRLMFESTDGLRRVCRSGPRRYAPVSPGSHQKKTEDREDYISPDPPS
jgi:hypothetical protein